MEEFIGMALKQIRTNAGLTQEQLADRIGSSTGAISKMECSRRSPSMRQLVKIANSYDMQVSAIVELAEQLSESRTRVINDRSVSYILANQRVMAPFMRLSSADQGLVEAVIVRLSLSDGSYVDRK
jgi:transcriptional regulator with XRE-family HTH domain